MTGTRCAECGAVYPTDDDSCAAHFDELLALDHSRQEPWGSRHGQAFAAFALQHPARFAASLDHAWAALYRIYVAGDRPRVVFERLRASRGVVPVEWAVPPRPPRAVAAASLTIADLGSFDASVYAERLDAWCRAALTMWGGGGSAGEPRAVGAEESR